MSIPETASVESVVGRIWAKDRDVGANAEMKYSIIDGDGRDTFGISTDPTNLFGIITVKKVGGHVAAAGFRVGSGQVGTVSTGACVIPSPASLRPPDSPWTLRASPATL